MRLKEILIEFLRPTWKKIILFIILSFLFVVFRPFSSLLSLFFEWFSLYSFFELFSDISFSGFFFVYLLNYLLACFLIFLWNIFNIFIRLKELKKERSREFELAIFIGIFLNALAFFILPLYILFYKINYPLYLVLSWTGLSKLPCLLGIPICSDEGGMFFWIYLIPIISGTVYGGIIGFIIHIIRGKGDENKIRKLRKGLLVFLTIIFLIILMFFLWKLYNMSIGCDYREGQYEQRVYDSQGRITGIVNGEEKREIPQSFLIGETLINLYDTNEKYTYEIFCLKEGNYISGISYINNFYGSYLYTMSPVREGIIFNAENIPISAGSTYRYSFDWNNLEKGGEGVTMLIDDNNDKVFEKVITSDNKLSCTEFLLRTGKSSGNKILGIGIIFLIIACVIIICFIKIIIFIIKYKKRDLTAS